MDADWEVEIGGDAPVLDAHWLGFIDLRAHPERVDEITEAAAFPPLADMLIALNSARSALWTSKCDVWDLENGGLACYVDLLSLEPGAFSDWRHAENCCRQWIARLTARTEQAADESVQRSSIPAAENGPESEAAITLVVRRAVAGRHEGFGITAYISAEASGLPDAPTAVAAAMVAFLNSMPGPVFPEAADHS